MIGKARAETFVERGRLEAVDLLDGDALLLGEGLVHVAGAGVVRGDDAVLARDRVGDVVELAVHQHMQVSGAELDVVLGIE